MKVKVYAKINLALDVLGVADKMHTLSMCNASIDLFDIVTVEKSDQMSCDFAEVPFADNIAVKAAYAMKKEFNIGNVKISIKKGIPYGGGFGGSSADGAAVIYCMRKLFGINDNDRINKVAISLGSDVPYMLVGGFCFVCGIGERVERIDTDLNFDGVIVKGQLSTNTKEVYAAYDKSIVKNNHTSKTLKMALEQKDYEKAISLFSNDLETPSKIVNKDIEKSCEILNKYNPKKVLVSGSGAGVFAIYDNPREVIKKIEKEIIFSSLFTTKNCGIEEID